MIITKIKISLKAGQILLLCSACMLSLQVQSQDGEPFMSHILKERVPGNKITAICDDLENTMIFTGNTGVITFDSEEWQIIQVPNIPLSISSDSVLPLIYVGGRGFFGYLLKSADGHYAYYGLGEEGEDPGDIGLIYQTTRDVIYYSEDQIAVADRNQLYNLEYYKSDSIRIFSGLLIYRDKAFVNLLGRGIYELSEGQFVRLEIEHDLSSSEILFSANYHDSLALLGLDDNRVFIFDGHSFTQVGLEDQEYLSESYLESAARLDINTFAFSTILGGCLIVDVTTGETRNILNYNTGLPDDEIYAIGVDHNRGLWLSHQYGLTRVDVGLPVRSFENYPGLSGNLTAVAVLDSIIYLGTHDAVFFLEEKQEFIEKEITVRVRTPETPITEPLQTGPEETGPEETAGETTLEDTLSARELRQLNRQDRRDARRQSREAEEEETQAAQATEEIQGEALKETQKATSEETQGEVSEEPAQGESRGLRSLIARIGGRTREETVQEQQQPQEMSPRSLTRYIKQKIYSLQSISHEYTKLGDLESRAKDMVTMGERIIISTNAGLYEIVDRELRIVREGWYVEGIVPTWNPLKMHVATDETLFTLELREDQWQTTASYAYIDEEIYSACEEKDSTLWLGCDNLAYRIRHLNDSVTTMDSFVFHEEFYDPVTVRNINDTVYFFLSGNIYYHVSDSLYLTEYPGNQVLSQIFASNCAITWIKSGENWFSMKNQENYNDGADLYLNLFSDINDLFLDPDGNVWVLHANQYLHQIKSSQVPQYRPDFNIYIKSVYNESRNYDLTDLQFDYYDRSLVFNFSAPFYLKESSTSYQYYIEGMSERWSEWANVPDLSFPVLPMGRYTLHIKARNVLNQVTETKSFPIVIKPPYWLSWWFISLASVFLVAIVAMLIRWRVRKLRYDNLILEQKVRERTAEILKQKDEIAEQKMEIMDSIYYAQRIQKAVLPADHRIQETMPEHFILYMPRDIVSGDFYWISSKDDKIIFAVADCTGHGVPGAFMSMLGISFLNEIVNKARRLSSGRILDQLRDHVKETLSQSEEGGSKDGMDIALCILDQQKMTLQYAGAFNPLYLIRNSELIEYKADRMPIGIHVVKESNFIDNIIQLKKGDCMYIFSDGYQDQIGGEKDKKFLSKSLKALLSNVHSQPMESQKKILHDTIRQWMEGYQQVDDILVLGVRV